MLYGTYAKTPAERVAAGAGLLDERRPGWEHEVSLWRLSMINVRRCVLGQLYGDFGDGLRALRLGSGVGHGFIPEDGARNRWKAYRQLRKAWVRTVRARRREGR